MRALAAFGRYTLALAPAGHEGELGPHHIIVMEKASPAEVFGRRVGEAPVSGEAVARHAGDLPPPSDRSERPAWSRRAIARLIVQEGLLREFPVEAARAFESKVEGFLLRAGLERDPQESATPRLPRP
jgi:hypothetical protein